ncbi:MAG TPA: hypothetical protein VIA07_11150 [Desulfuromonadales bacterium]
MPFVISPRLIRKARPVGLRIAATLTVVALLYTEPLHRNGSLPLG